MVNRGTIKASRVLQTNTSPKSPKAHLTPSIISVVQSRSCGQKPCSIWSLLAPSMYKKATPPKITDPFYPNPSSLSPPRGRTHPPAAEQNPAAATCHLPTRPLRAPHRRPIQAQGRPSPSPCAPRAASSPPAPPRSAFAAAPLGRRLAIVAGRRATASSRARARLPAFRRRHGELPARIPLLRRRQANQ